MDDLSTALEAARVTPRETVVVDALNFLERFVSVDSEPPKNAPELFAECRSRVGQLARAAANSSMRMIFVFDNGQTTEEALEKWWSRREAEVMLAERRMPCSAELAFMAILQEHGFETLYPPGTDGDDAVAMLAWLLGAKALSRDRDLLRYEELPRSRVACDFAIKRGRVLLSPQRAPLATSTRSLEVIKAELLSAQPGLALDTFAGAAALIMRQWGRSESTMRHRAVEEGRSRRGNADGLTRDFGNLNALARPMLAAVYRAAGARSTVTLTLPGVDSERRFERQVFEVEPSDADAGLNAAVKDVRLATVALGNLTAWPSNATSKRQRAHAVCMLAAEIVDCALPPEAGVSSVRRVLRLYNQAVAESEHLEAASVTPESTAWAQTKACAGLRGRLASCGCQGIGEVFPAQAKASLLRGKDPLCHKCVNAITRR